MRRNARRAWSGRWTAVLALIVAGVSHAALAQSPGASPTSPAEQVESPRLDRIWYDGRGSLFAASPGVVHRFDDDAEPISWPTDLGSAVGGDGYAGRKALVAFVSADGMIARYRGEAWDAERLELRPGEQARAVAIDGAADVYVLTDRAVHYWAKGRIKPFALPDEAQGKMRAAMVSAGGRMYLTGDDGLVYAFDGRIYDRIIPVGVSEKALRSSWRDCWLSADGHRLWIRAADDRVVELDPRDGASREYILPRPAGDEAADERGPSGDPISGESFASRDRVVTTMGGRVFGFEHDRFVPLATLPPGSIDDIIVAGDRGRVEVLIDGHIVDVALEPEPTAVGGEVSGEKQVQNLEQIWRRDERRRRRGAYTSRGLFVPSIDVRVGPSWTLAPGGAQPATSFALDAGAGVLIAPFEPTDHPTLWLWPQLGYTLDTHPDYGHHGVYLATGVGFGGTLFEAFYTPGLLAGAGRGAAMVGFRHGVSANTLWGAVGVELRHQVQRVGDRTEQDLGLMFNLNLAPIIWLAIVANID